MIPVKHVSSKGKHPKQPWLFLVALVAVVVFGAVGFWQSAAPQEMTIERNDQDQEVEESSSEASSQEEAPAPETNEEQAASQKAAQEGGSPSGEVSSTVKVHVDGAVAAPGVIELVGQDLRVADAVALCGGLTENADTSAINLAAQIHDADKIHIPVQGEVQTQAAQPSGVGTQESSSPEPSASPGLVNLNSASAEELCELPGVGEATAQKIIDDREANGPFSSVEDLMRVSGIGEKKLEQIKDLACV